MTWHVQITLIGITYCSLLQSTFSCNSMKQIRNKLPLTWHSGQIREQQYQSSCNRNKKSLKKKYTTQQNVVTISAATLITFKSHHLSKLYQGWTGQQQKKRPHFAPRQTGNANDDAKLFVLVKRGWLFGWIYRKLAHNALTHFLYLMSSLISSSSWHGSLGHQLRLGKK